MPTVPPILTMVSTCAVTLLLGRLVAVRVTPSVAVYVLTAIGLLWAATMALILRRMRRVRTPVGRTLPMLVMLILLYCVMGTLLLVS